MKKKKDSATKNQRYMAIFLAATMLLSVFVVFVNNNSKTDRDNDVPVPELDGNITTFAFSQIQGKQVQHEFNSIADGLEMSPEGPVNALYVDLQKTRGTPLEMALGSIEMMNSFYGADVTKRYSTNYADGSGFELHQIPEQKLAIPMDTRVYPYNDYQMLYRTNGTYNIWNVVGNPAVMGPIQSVRSVVDVLEGNATAASEYDQLLVLADPEDSIYQEVGTKTNLTDIPADKYYRDLKKLDDGSYMQTSIFLNPKPELTEKISTMQANCTERGVAYSVTNEGEITKLVITADFESLYAEDNLLLI
ncbi:hypothetical protein FTO70_01910 [Methanosarcina sp. KYL-1]|uniref:hypothetical protein n=1 Tax=Methanosarcina sp. KYL-1 TaxID=2602068 RepID=UPI0021013538|nr:hypothetical protein [Methanosarcina sp. KYL-1]MCQ1534472.1 hypothetical protein [Methanosarcina sp. KYL-1]